MRSLAGALGVFLIVVGVSHFLVPRYFETLVPPWVPQARALVFASGFAELVIGAGLLLPRTRTLAAWAASMLMAVYVLTHVDALLRARADNRRILDRPSGAIARVAVNVCYLAWAVIVALHG